MEVEVPRIDVQALGELPVRQLLVVLAEQLERPEAERVPEGLQLLGPLDREEVLEGGPLALRCHAANI